MQASGSSCTIIVKSLPMHTVGEGYGLEFPGGAESSVAELLIDIQFDTVRKWLIVSNKS